MEFNQTSMSASRNLMQLFIFDDTFSRGRMIVCATWFVIFMNFS